MSLSGVAGEKIKSPGWVVARGADKGVRKLEQNNVFYVAMTRARDLVVLSGAGTQKPNGWLKQAEIFLESASPKILKKRCFSDIPEVEAKLPEVRGQGSEVSYVPLNIPKGSERRPVTSLCRKNSSTRNQKTAIVNSPQYGILGHAVLEELAKNGWDGDIPEMVERFGRASLSERLSAIACRATAEAALVEQLEAARKVLRKETEGAEALFVEHPFVLKRDDMILDGTIDLLVQKSSKAWKIFDYKFSNESPETALETYSPQLAAYQEAVEKLNPSAEVSAALVLIGEAVQIISLPA